MAGPLAQSRRRFGPHAGWYTLLAAALLTTVGVIAIDTVRPEAASTQLKRWIPVGLVAMALCFVPNPRAIGRSAYILFGLTLCLLIFLILPGVPRSLVPIRNGARSWILLPGGSIQPSELAKIGFVLALAWYLRYRDSYRRLTGFIPPTLFMAVPVLLILKQPDLGTAMIFPAALYAMLLAAGAKLRHLGAITLAGVLALTLVVSAVVLDPPHQRSAMDGGNTSLPAWAHVLADHQEKRIAALIWPDEYLKQEAFQQQTAVRLVGAGGLFGHGKQRTNTLVAASGLPEPHNDVVFAVLVNRWGVVGGLTVMMLYGVLVLMMLLTAAGTKDPFARLVCVGFAAMILAQATINIAMNLGLMPIIGITLPLISYGGSSLLTTYIMVGLTLNFASRKQVSRLTTSFEFDRQDPLLR